MEASSGSVYGFLTLLRKQCLEGKAPSLTSRTRARAAGSHVMLVVENK